MNITMTLVGQMITFAIFVWFTMRYVWPPLKTAMAERKKKISDGLQAAEDAKQELADARRQAEEIIQDAKSQSNKIIDQANERAHRVEEAAKEEARASAERIRQNAYAEIENEKYRIKEELKGEVADLAIISAEKILQKNLDEKTNKQFIDKYLTEQL